VHRRNYLKCAQAWITQFYLQITSCLPYTPQLQSITAFWLLLILPCEMFMLKNGHDPELSGALVQNNHPMMLAQFC